MDLAMAWDVQETKVCVQTTNELRTIGVQKASHWEKKLATCATSVKRST